MQSCLGYVKLNEIDTYNVNQNYFETAFMLAY
jgi:hypothetical protein